MSLKVSPSQLETYWDCPEKWDLTYLQGYKSKAKKKTYDKGNYTHELMHVYYHMVEKGGVPGSDELLGAVLARVVQDLQHMKAEDATTYNVVSKLMTKYIMGASRAIDLGIKVLAVEAEILYDVVTPAGRHITLQGIADLMYRDRSKRIRIRDHKTTGNFSSWSRDKVAVHGQLLQYGTIIYKVTGELPIVEVNCLDSTDYKRVEKRADQIHKLLPFEPNQATYEGYWELLLNQIDRMYDSPVIRHFSTRCVSCPFHDVCTLRLRGVSADRILENNFEVVDRDSARYRTGFSQEHSEPNVINLSDLDFNFGG